LADSLDPLTLRVQFVVHSKMKVLRIPAFFLAALFLFLGCRKESSGVVISVADGDTFVITDGPVQKRIRLFGIDCPEYTQAFGKEAREFTAQLVLGKTIRLQAVEKDTHGRIVAKVYLPDGRYLNGEIVSAGYGWWFRKYAPRDALLEKLEREAKTAKRGLWGASNSPLEPWNFRGQDRNRANAQVPSQTPGAIEITDLRCNGNGANEPDESVELQNRSSVSVVMSGWILHDEGSNHSLTFPEGFQIHPGEKCRIYTNLQTGCISFGESRSAIWNNRGDRAYLMDSTGQLVATRDCDE
jgi:micrococcal nuclease